MRGVPNPPLPTWSFDCFEFASTISTWEIKWRSHAYEKHYRQPLILCKTKTILSESGMMSDIVWYSNDIDRGRSDDRMRTWIRERWWEKIHLRTSVSVWSLSSSLARRPSPACCTDRASFNVDMKWEKYWFISFVKQDLQNVFPLGNELRCAIERLE